MTAVGFEPTPLRTGALSQRLRPLGQTVLYVWGAHQAKRACVRETAPTRGNRVRWRGAWPAARVGVQMRASGAEFQIPRLDAWEVAHFRGRRATRPPSVVPTPSGAPQSMREVVAPHAVGHHGFKRALDRGRFARRLPLLALSRRRSRMRLSPQFILRLPLRADPAVPHAQRCVPCCAQHSTIVPVGVQPSSASPARFLALTLPLPSCPPQPTRAVSRARSLGRHLVLLCAAAFLCARLVNCPAWPPVCVVARKCARCLLTCSLCLWCVFLFSRWFSRARSPARSRASQSALFVFDIPLFEPGWLSRAHAPILR